MTESEKLLPKLKRRTSSTKLKQPNTRHLGQAGEIQAQQFLTSFGYRIIATNVMYPCGEIDIVALDQTHQELVFVEVKTRSQDWHQAGFAAVNYRKRRALTRAAQLFRRQHCYNLDYRFDIIVVTPAGVEHVENITMY